MASPSWTRESSLAIFLLIVTNTFFSRINCSKWRSCTPLALNHLPDGHRRRHFASEIAFAVGRLELSHQGNRHHLRTALLFNPVDSIARAQP